MLDLLGGFCEIVFVLINYVMNIDCDVLYLFKSFMCIIKKKLVIVLI